MKPITKFARLFIDKPLNLECGKNLSNITVAYQTYGDLNSDGTNGILICHALTGNSHAAGIISDEEIDNSNGNEFLKKYNRMYLKKPGWWDDLIGKEKVFDTNKYFVICSNILGSCYGTTGPSSINDVTQNKYNMTFPYITVRDMVKVQKALCDFLKINRLVTVTGGSLGGMQVMEWSAMYGEMLDSIIPIATCYAHSPWAIGLNESARIAITNDSNWKDGDYTTQPINGLILARRIGMQSYRSYKSFLLKYGREKKDKDYYQVQSYLRYQGEKFANRFDANSFLYLSNAMDNHDITQGRDKVENVLGNFKMNTLCIGISSDILYPAEEQKEIAKMIPNGKYAEINSIHGHDAFLIEFEQMTKIIKIFLDSV
ncbi:MAG: homoserine O-acetyltransferase [Ignavibacteriales bacterium]|nr:homoserine O-acetyltransferase [Ignavibacteriales bacterium]